MKKTIASICLFAFVISVLCAQNNQSNFDLIAILNDENLPETLKESLAEDLSPDATIFNDSLKSTSKTFFKSNQGLKASRQSSLSKPNETSIGSLIKSLNQQMSPYYREKLDSIEWYGPVVVPTYDSLNTDINEYKTDENGFIVEQIIKTLNKSTLEWRVDKLVLKNDDSGRPVERISLNWDGVNWNNMAKVVFEYDNNGNLINIFGYNFSPSIPGNYYFTDKTERIFDESNRLLSEINYGSDGVFVNSKTEYAYNEKGQVLKYSRKSSWDYNLKTWRLQVNAYTEYNEQGETISQIDSLFNINALEWEIKRKDKFEYIYQGDGSILRNTYKLNLQTNEQYLASREKLERRYENEKLIEEIRYSDDGNDGWQRKSKIEYRYDQLGNELFYGFYETPFGEWELMSHRTQVYSEEGRLLKRENESYTMDYELYRKKGSSFTQYLYDQMGNMLSYTAYNWDNENQDWLVYRRIHRINTTSNQYEMQTFTYNKNGTKTLFEKEFVSILDYDMNIGKYTAIKEGDYEVQIAYNKDLKVKEVFIPDPDYGDGKVECFYDESGRDTAWYHFNKEDELWQFDWKQTFSYSKPNETVTKVSERWAGDNENGWTDFYYKNDTLISIVEREYNIDLGVWNSVDSIIYSYNEDGKLSQIINETDEERYKTEYKFLNDTLTVNGYYFDFQESKDWNLSNKTVLKINTNISKEQFQQIPSVIFDGNAYAFEFHSQFEYGEVMSSTEYSNYGEDGMRISGQSIFHYSPASLLSGEGVISGFVYEGAGSGKSISISEEGETPVKGVAVSLLDSKDNFILVCDTTETNGFYEFRGVPKGDFYLKVELQGYTQTSTYTLNVTKESSIFENKNFIVQNGELFTNIDELGFGIKVYPNPASGLINIYSFEQIVSLRIIDLNGQVKLGFNESDIKNNSIPINNLKNGMYIIEIRTINEIYRSKIIKKD
ncbi:MAG TPA: T9SS type A sorting domain-containing protein [Draconibacterium sp.]|nr:T9SS type A sorting domain-containing protein [Draconibacterium sp.]